MKLIATKPVSLFWQTVFIIVIDVYAVYRIQKLRRYLQIVILPTAIIATIFSSIFTDFNCEYDWSLIVIGYDSCLPFEINLVIQMIYGLIMVYSIYLIRKWSMEWNRKFPLVRDAGYEDE